MRSLSFLRQGLSGSRPANSLRCFSSETKQWKVARPFRVHKLDACPDESVESTKEEALKFYETMFFYRRFETVCDTLYKEKAIKGFLHLYDGQEACVVGMEAALKKTDSIITAYRDHCHALSRGESPGAVMAEMLGKQTGSSKGKGGSMHYYAPEQNFYGGNGIVGAQVPVGAGIAFAHKYTGDGGLCVAAYGDGAANQGQVFEAANMAHLWSLPIIFLCENNQYAMGTSVGRHTTLPDFYTRGIGVPGIWIDGMDVLAVKKGFKFAADYIRAGNGPLFMELNTYRYHGHSMSDPGISYRSRDEVSQVRQERDCIELLKKRIIEAGWANAADLKKIEKQARKLVDEAVTFARESPDPPLKEAYTDIYHKEIPKRIRATDPAKDLYV
eukprot:gb/GEZN01010208.1/.p1 GENE.gb/GEZN01010208.1/~~gb/GEZN01010208.1/.p1  ORF type:complete len:386 (+),score=61.05 gb/GEZN01010208.1/:31-1188(+)